MGANCSNCNCTRDEKELELKLEEKGGKVIHHEQNFTGDEVSQLNMNDVVSI